MENTKTEMILSYRAQKYLIAEEAISNKLAALIAEDKTVTDSDKDMWSNYLTVEHAREFAKMIIDLTATLTAEDFPEERLRDIFVDLRARIETTPNAERGAWHASIDAMTKMQAWNWLWDHSTLITGLILEDCKQDSEAVLSKLNFFGEMGS